MTRSSSPGGPAIARVARRAIRTGWRQRARSSHRCRRFAGLAVIGLLTLAVLTGNIPFLPSRSGRHREPGQPEPRRPGRPGRTPSPSAPPVVNPDVGIDGTIVYAKAGNLWIQTGTTRPRSSRRPAATPSRRGPRTGRGSTSSRPARRRRASRASASRCVYDLRYAVLTRIRPDGSDREVVLSGLFKAGPSNQYAWVVLHPRSGRRAERPDRDRRLRRPRSHHVGRRAGAGQRVPQAAVPARAAGERALRPPGSRMAARRHSPAVRSQRAGRRPRRPSHLALRTGHEEELAPEPARVHGAAVLAERAVLVATKTSTLGTDIVVLDARNSNEVLRVTSGRPVMGRRVVAGRDADRVPAAGRVDDGHPGRDDQARRARRPLRRHDQAADGVQRARRRQPARVVGTEARRPTPTPTRRHRGALRHAGPVSEPLPRSTRPPDASTGTVLCVGIDPTPEMLPDGWPGDLPGSSVWRA